MNQVLPRQRTPSAAGPPPGDVRLVLVGHAEREPIEARAAWRREVEHELVAVVEVAFAVDRLVVANGQVALEAGGRSGAARSIAMDFTQWMMFCSLRCARAAWATSRAVQGSDGRAPTLRKSEPSGLSTRSAAPIHVLVHSRYSDCERVSS